MVSPVLANALLNIKSPDLVGSFQRGQEQAKQQQIGDLKGQILSGEHEKFDELRGLAPEVAVQLQQGLMSRNAAELDETIKASRYGAAIANSGDREGLAQYLADRSTVLRSQGRNTDSTDRLMSQLQGGDFEGVKSQLNSFNDAVLGAKAQSASMVNREALLKDLDSSDPRRVKAAEVALGLRSKAAAGEGEGKLSPTMHKRLFEFQDATKSAGAKVRNADVLLGRLDNVELRSGLLGSASEAIRAITSSQDEASSLRRDLNKFSLSEVLDLLPPGPATDKDVEEAKKGVPHEGANADQFRSFLRGAKKIAQLEKEVNAWKSNYISSNRSPVDMVKSLEEAISRGEIPSLDTDGNFSSTVERVETPAVSATGAQVETPTGIVEGAVAVNPATGERIQFVNGKWVKI